MRNISHNTFYDNNLVSEVVSHIRSTKRNCHVNSKGPREEGHRREYRNIAQEHGHSVPSSVKSKLMLVNRSGRHCHLCVYIHLVRKPDHS